jgi:diguanylate cyclase (GGDEF)-like protein
MSRPVAQAGSLRAPGTEEGSRIGKRGDRVRPRRPSGGASFARVTYVAMFVLLAAYLVLLAVRPADSDSTLIDGWGVDVFELLAGVLCIIGGRRTRPGSAVPIVLGAAVVFWGVGDALITVQSLGGATPPTPSPADALYICFFPLTYAAVVLLVRGETRRLSTPTWLDGSVAGFGAAAVCAAFAFSPIVHTTGESTLGVAVNLAYPVGDVLLLLLVVGGTAVLSGRRMAPWLLIAAGLLVNVLGDTSNLLQSSIGATHMGVVLNSAAWPISTLLVSVAMWVSPGATDPLVVQRPPGFLLPGLASGAGLTILLVGTLRPVNHVATALALATLVLVVARTWQSVRHLTAQTRERHRQSVTDHLTGLPNRRRLFEALDAFFAQPPADRPELSFLFIDLDGFKRVNDSFGHPAGDEVLVQVSARLAQTLRPTDLLARIGGDEFAAILVATDDGETETIAARLGESLEEPFRLDAVSASIAASIGIARAPGDATDAEGLMGCADAAMFEAKLNAKPFSVFDRERERGGDKLRLADDLSGAIESDQLVLHYQPQLDLHTGEVSTVEALVRWHHPEFGLIAPLQFLGLAEEAGLMGRLTRRVLADALTQGAAWHAAGRWTLVSVNVSVADLLDPAFPETVATMLAERRMPAEALTIEITETSIIAEFERAQQAVARLRGLGVGVSIDDFGAGFTSLAYLNELAVDELKLDRRFIAPLAGGARGRDAELVRATIALGHALGLRVVAEGIEDPAALELLRELGCDVAQGYALGRPVPAGELALAALAPEPAAASQTSTSVRCS